MRLPKRLTVEPILDSMFEVRFNARAPLASILPGVFFTALGATNVERMPGADVPDAMKSAEPSLRVLASQKIHWDKFYILVADEALAVGCKLPYPGWNEFKAAISRVMSIVCERALIDKVTRYSIKYVNLLVNGGAAETLEMLDVKLKVGTTELVKENFQLRAELQRDKYLSVVQILSAANAINPSINETKSGAIIDVDTIYNCVSTVSFEAFVAALDQASEELHGANKALFFECLKEKTIESMGATYD